MVKAPRNCMNIRTAGAVRTVCKSSLTNVCLYTDLSGDEDHSAVAIERSMSTQWPPVRTENFKNRKRVQHPRDHKDNDQLIALKTALPESIACSLICFEKRQAKTRDNGLPECESDV